MSKQICLSAAPARRVLPGDAGQGEGGDGGSHRRRSPLLTWIRAAGRRPGRAAGRSSSSSAASTDPTAATSTGRLLVCTTDRRRGPRVRPRAPHRNARRRPRPVRFRLRPHLDGLLPRPQTAQFSGRYGGREADSAEGRGSLAGSLRHARRPASRNTAAGKAGNTRPAGRRARTVMDDYRGDRRLSGKALRPHCHQVYDLTARPFQAAGQVVDRRVVGLPAAGERRPHAQVDRGDRVAARVAASSAAAGGVRKGDRLRTVNGRPVASFADVQYALHMPLRPGQDSSTWRRERASEKAGDDAGGGLARRPDVPGAGRWPARPAAQVQGEDLSAEEKKDLGLGPPPAGLSPGGVREPARRDRPDPARTT